MSSLAKKHDDSRLSARFAVAIPSIDRFRRRKLRNAVESESPKVPVDAVPSESESP